MAAGYVSKNAVHSQALFAKVESRNPLRNVQRRHTRQKATFFIGHFRYVKIELDGEA